MHMKWNEKTYLTQYNYIIGDQVMGFNIVSHSYVASLSTESL